MIAKQSATKLMNGYEYIDSLIKSGAIERSKLKWIQFVWVYTNDEVVYKVVIQYDYRTLKKAKKYGVNGEWSILKGGTDDMLVKLNLDNEKMKIGKMLMKFDAIKRDITYWSGEEW